MPQDAQNIKISGNAWELLRWAKFDLQVKSYSDAIVELDKKIKNRVKSLQKSLKDFDEERHRIKIKTPDDRSSPPERKPKTILLRPEAHRILNRLKLESNEPAYTLSDAIEFLVEENALTPEHLRK